MFLGDIYASASDVVFPQFKRADHYKTADKLDEKIHYINYCGNRPCNSNGIPFKSLMGLQLLSNPQIIPISYNILFDSCY